MTLIGVGVDLVSIERIDRVYNKYSGRFLRRILTASEENSFRKRGASTATLAARFAAKEAVLKAIGCGIGPAAMNEIEIIAAAGRQPKVKLYGRASSLAREKGITEIYISMSHESPLACAFATAIGKPE